jgi:VWFA-related protein
LLTGGTITHGGTPAQEAVPANRAAPLRVTTRMVQLNVIVDDKHGNPVTNLTKDDFVVLDEKRPQAIQYFSFETSQAPEHPPAPAPLPPDTYTLKVGAAYSQSIEIAPNAAEVRVVLRDSSNGNLGSVSVPLDKYYPVPKDKE